MRNRYSLLFMVLLACGLAQCSSLALAAGPTGPTGPIGTPGPIHSTPGLDSAALSGLVAVSYWGYQSLKNKA